MTIQYVLLPAFTKQCWPFFDKVKDSSTFFSNNLIISPTQHLCDCKLLRAAGNGVPFAAMIRDSRSHVTVNDNQQIITRTSDFLVIHGIVFTRKGYSNTPGILLEYISVKID